MNNPKIGRRWKFFSITKPPLSTSHRRYVATSSFIYRQQTKHKKSSILVPEPLMNIPTITIHNHRQSSITLRNYPSNENSNKSNDSNRENKIDIDYQERKYDSEMEPPADDRSSTSTILSHEIDNQSKLSLNHLSHSSNEEEMKSTTRKNNMRYKRSTSSAVGLQSVLVPMKRYSSQVEFKILQKIENRSRLPNDNGKKKKEENEESQLHSISDRKKSLIARSSIISLASRSLRKMSRCNNVLMAHITPIENGSEKNEVRQRINEDSRNTIGSEENTQMSVNEMDNNYSNHSSLHMNRTIGKYWKNAKFKLVKKPMSARISVAVDKTSEGSMITEFFSQHKQSIFQKSEDMERLHLDINRNSMKKNQFSNLVTKITKLEEANKRKKLMSHIHNFITFASTTTTANDGDGTNNNLQMNMNNLINNNSNLNGDGSRKITFRSILAKHNLYSNKRRASKCQFDPVMSTEIRQCSEFINRLNALQDDSCYCHNTLTNNKQSLNNGEVTEIKEFIVQPLSLEPIIDTIPLINISRKSEEVNQSEEIFPSMNASNATGSHLSLHKLYHAKSQESRWQNAIRKLRHPDVNMKRGSIVRKPFKRQNIPIDSDNDIKTNCSMYLIEIGKMGSEQMMTRGMRPSISCHTECELYRCLRHSSSAVDRRQSLTDEQIESIMDERCQLCYYEMIYEQYVQYRLCYNCDELVRLLKPEDDHLKYYSICYQRKLILLPMINLMKCSDQSPIKRINLKKSTNCNTTPFTSFRSQSDDITLLVKEELFLNIQNSVQYGSKKFKFSKMKVKKWLNLLRSNQLGSRRMRSSTLKESRQLLQLSMPKSPSQNTYPNPNLMKCPIDQKNSSTSTNLSNVTTGYNNLIQSSRKYDDSSINEKSPFHYVTNKDSIIPTIETSLIDKNNMLTLSTYGKISLSTPPQVNKLTNKSMVESIKNASSSEDITKLSNEDNNSQKFFVNEEKCPTQLTDVPSMPAVLDEVKNIHYSTILSENMKKYVEIVSSKDLFLQFIGYMFPGKNVYSFYEGFPSKVSHRRLISKNSLQGRNKSAYRKLILSRKNRLFHNCTLYRTIKDTTPSQISQSDSKEYIIIDCDDTNRISTRTSPRESRNSRGTLLNVGLSKWKFLKQNRKFLSSTSSNPLTASSIVENRKQITSDIDEESEVLSKKVSITNSEINEKQESVQENSKKSSKDSNSLKIQPLLPIILTRYRSKSEVLLSNKSNENALTIRRKYSDKLSKKVQVESIGDCGKSNDTLRKNQRNLKSCTSLLPPTGDGDGGEWQMKKKFKKSLRSSFAKLRRSHRTRTSGIRARELQAQQTLMIVLVVFILLYLPFFTLMAIYVTFPNYFVNDYRLSQDIFYGLTWLGYSSSGINPCLYAFLNRHFKRAFRNLFQCKRDKTQRPTM
ncbi:hypothetical protein SNEBB_006637 [Seison nebaliae]|nr:hypothetical protein SNEBB_006637 [Seison nebaliae]